MNKTFYILLFLGTFGFSQTAPNKFSFSNNIGISEYAVENEYKVNAFNHSIYLGKEFKLTKSYFLVSNLGYSNYYYDVLSKHHKSSFIEMPILVRFHLSPINSNQFYTGIGLNNKLKINEKIQDNVNNKISKNKDNGYHLGTYAELGYKTKVGKKLQFSIGLNYSGDLLELGYQKKNIINNQVNLSIGLNVLNN